MIDFVGFMHIVGYKRWNGKLYQLDKNTGKLLGWAQTSLGRGQTGCLIHTLHAQSDNVLYKGSCTLWDVEKITIKGGGKAAATSTK